MTNPLIVDCNSCAVRGLECGDCLITVLLGPEGQLTHRDGHAAAPVELSTDEAAAAAALSLSGLVPPLRLVRTSDRHGGFTSEPAQAWGA